MQDALASLGHQRLSGVRREVYMFALVAALSLNYYYMQVMVEIYSLPSTVVFLPHRFGLPS
jgi:hypothetical protein